MYYTVAIAFIIFELTLICLSIWPHVGSLALLPTLIKVTVEETTIRPLEQALTLHHIVIEWSLVDFTPRRDSSSISVYLPLLKETFEHGAARVCLKAYSVRLHAILVNLPAVLGTTPAEFKLIFHQSAGVEFII